MSIQQILLSLPTYPDAPPEQTLESAVFLAQKLQAAITACIPQLDSDSKSWPSPLGSWPVDVRGLMGETVLQSEHNAQQLTDALAKLSAEYRIPVDMRRSLTTLYGSSQPLIDMARLHDLTLIPVPECDSFDRNDAQSVIFNSGRPALLLPSGPGVRSLRQLDHVVVAWDYSREAARALGDAMPILALAGQVHVLSVFGEKGIETSCTTADLEHYLAAHRLNHVRVDRTLTEGSVSALLESYASEIGADMLVMGAYGHSRFREFVLGGTTRGIMSGSSLPVFLSH